MNCDRVFALLSEYLDNELPPTEREQFEAHVSTCTRCSQFGAEFVAVVDGLKHAGRQRPAPPARLTEALDALAKR